MGLLLPQLYNSSRNHLVITYKAAYKGTGFASFAYLCGSLCLFRSKVNVKILQWTRFYNISVVVLWSADLDIFSTAYSGGLSVSHKRKVGHSFVPVRVRLFLSSVGCVNRFVPDRKPYLNFVIHDVLCVGLEVAESSAFMRINSCFGTSYVEL